MQLLPSFRMSVFWSCVPKFSSFSSSLGGYHYRAWNFVLHAHTHACVCMCMCVCMLYMYAYMFVNKHAGMHMNACKCWHHMSFSIIFYYYLQREGLSLTSELDPGFPFSTSWALVLQMGSVHVWIFCECWRDELEYCTASALSREPSPPPFNFGFELQVWVKHPMLLFCIFGLFIVSHEPVKTGFLMYLKCVCRFF